MTEATICRRLLQLRDNNYSLAHVLRSAWPRWFILGGLLALNAYLATGPREDVRWLAGLVASFLAGVLLRDAASLLRVKKLWPLTVRITRWETVQQISDGENADSPPSGALPRS